MENLDQVRSRLFKLCAYGSICYDQQTKTILDLKALQIKKDLVDYMELKRVDKGLFLLKIYYKKLRLFEKAPKPKIMMIVSENETSTERTKTAAENESE